MSTGSKNYLEDILNDGLELLTSNKIEWPTRYTKEMKIRIIEGQIQYWSEREDYSKCKLLQDILIKMQL